MEKTNGNFLSWKWKCILNCQHKQIIFTHFTIRTCAETEISSALELRRRSPVTATPVFTPPEPPSVARRRKRNNIAGLAAAAPKNPYSAFSTRTYPASRTDSTWTAGRIGPGSFRFVRLRVAVLHNFVFLWRNMQIFVTSNQHPFWECRHELLSVIFYKF